ncbi:MAG: hypothetical protein ACI4B3_10585 [Prevotella sp.]
MNTKNKKMYVKPEINVIPCVCKQSLLAGSTTIYVDGESVDFDYDEASGQAAY